MKLVCIKGAEKDTVWELSGFRTTIGRDSSCDIVVTDSMSSRIHAEIVREGNNFIFCDKKSRNGSFVNNKRVTGQVLVPGDQIKIGETTIKVGKDELVKTITWQQQNLLTTTKIPLGRFPTLIEELASSPEALARKHPAIAAAGQIRLEKLIKNLDTLYKVGGTINSIQTVDQLLDRIAETLLHVFSDVQRVCILINENGKDFQPKTIKTRAAVAPEPLRLSWSIVDEAVKEEVCVLAKDASHDGRFEASDSIIAMNLRSVMCAPLVNKGAVLGVIYVDNPEKPDCFDDSDIAMLSALASQSAIAIDNSRLCEDLQKSFHEAILALMNTVEAKDPYTRGHSQRTSRYALGIARGLGLSEEESKRVKTAAELHDIGKIGVRDLVIGKDSPLSTMEFDLMKAHVVTGENIIKPIAYLSFARPMIRHHHERYDGMGYPDGLKEDEIPLGAKIIGVADAFDAMTTQRPYNKPLTFKEALEEFETLKRTQFDPQVVDALIRFINLNYKDNEQ
ncbi:MAG: HD domain-containing protein [Deltaproteobacteria bacterium]|nr:MAG: HD domain-containing protein [Deltaproteobacteria bacterium]